MRTIASAFALAGFLAASALVPTASADTMKNCAATWKTMSAADKAKTTYKAFSTTCMKGGATAVPAAAAAPAAMAAPAKPKAAAVAAPAAAAAPAAMAAPAKPKAAAAAMPASTTAPAGATGQCKDGSYTMSKTHSGACSSHGGVAKWL
jgi:hypothetical protein